MNDLGFFVHLFQFYIRQHIKVFLSFDDEESRLEQLCGDGGVKRAVI